MPLISVKELRQLDQRGSPIFEPVSFDLAANTRLALVGKSGSGKTLVLRATTLLDPAEGTICYRGEPISDTAVPRYRRAVHLLAQSSPMFAGSVQFNLELPFTSAAIADAPFNSKRAKTLLARFDLAALLPRSIGELSGGEAQVVALVRALLIEPEVLLLDEPTSAMDPDRVRAAEELVDEWHADGARASIWVSHDAAQLARVTTSTLEVHRSDGEPG